MNSHTHDLTGESDWARTKRARTPAFTSAPIGLLQRKCTCGGAAGLAGECEECSRDKLSLQRSARNSGVGTSNDFGVPRIVHEVIRSPGEPLDPQTRAMMEPRFGHDFSKVRLHTDERAAESARAVNALAYTVDHDVVFAAGKHVPHTTEGRRLVAHELAHVAQQGIERPAAENKLRIGAPDTSAEREADEVAAKVLTGQLASMSSALPDRELRRDQPGSGTRAPIEGDRGFTGTPHLDPNLIDLSLRILRGEHQVTVVPGLSNPLNILGIPIPGMQPAQLSLLIGYDNRCNRAFQSALIGIRQTQPAGRLDPDFGRNPTEIEGRFGFRAGSVLIQPGGTVGFTGTTFDSFAFTLSFTTGVSREIPEECIAPPPRPTTRETETPDGGRTGNQDTPTEGERALPSYTLYFFYDTTMTRPESNPTLARVVSLLQTVPSLHVTLTGHASLEGTEGYNMGLSERRADAIRLQLSLEGIAASRIHTMHFGESAPAVPEPEINQRTLLPSVENIRNLNRRVEVSFFDPTGAYSSATFQLRLPILNWRRRHDLGSPSLGTPRLDF